jgi:phenylacetic acid degradation protein
VGDVVIGPRCFIGPCASLRGDFGSIRVEEGSNVQDTCVVHSFPGRQVLLERDSHVGHGAVLHGCTLKPNALIGMNAVVMDGAEIGEGAVVGACAFVKAGTIVAPATLVTGVPAVVVRRVTQEELRRKSEGTRLYQELARRCLATLREEGPLAREEERIPPAPGLSWGS